MIRDYPLWCVDTGDANSDMRYRGPFTTEAAAKSDMEDLHKSFHTFGEQHPLCSIRRCRRVQASELANACSAQRIAEDMDDDARPPTKSQNAWANWDEQIVSPVKGAQEALDIWADMHLKIDMYVCEGDE